MSVGIPEATRAEARRRLAAFLPAAGVRYGKARNFDFGPERRGNVSTLSPYLRHRLLLEDEVLEAVLGRHSPVTAGKFVQEVFWRTYFKGWLEHRPAVWDEYRSSLVNLIRSLDSDSDRLARYNAAIDGKTGIDCFDVWVDELVTTGYLHNHARMWFASIWVYTLRLPWQLGADFFYRHLLDGDAASNTLSWRWVCGLHTPGKTYLAQASNIELFTDKRFSPEGQLATSAPPLTEVSVFPPQPLPTPQALPQDERFGLLITEEDCSPESLLEDRAPVAIVGALATRFRSPLPVSEPVSTFATEAMTDALERTTRAFGVGGELSDAEDWGSMLAEWATINHLNTIVTPYVPVGPAAELLAGASDALQRYGIRLLRLRRSYDSTVWPHTRRGYFKLKEKIPAIVDRLELAPAVVGADSQAV